MSKANPNLEPKLMILKRIANELDQSTFSFALEDMTEARKLINDLSQSVKRTRMLLWKLKKLTDKK